MLNKTVLAAAIIATAIASVCVAAQEMARSENNSELALKLMAFISLIIFDIYAIVVILRDKDK